MKRVLYISTTPVTFDVLMQGHFEYMQGEGFAITAVSSPGPSLDKVAAREGVNVVPVRMQREVNPLRDLWSLFQLVRVIKRVEPDIVNAGTPKAGMLGMVASYIARVPTRIYTVRGLRGETLNGFRSLLVSFTERIAAASATEVLCVSHSLSQLYLDLGYTAATKSVVLGHGSSNGVDTARFRPSAEARVAVRADYGISSDSVVIGFVGRMVKDKGIAELVKAFAVVRASTPDAVLLLVGDYEPGDPVDDETKRHIARDDRIIVAGFVADPAPYYSAFDILAFPSYREGFPNAPLEAAAAGVPCVGFDATGTRDAIVNGQTGTLVSIGDWKALAHEIEAYITYPGMRAERGRAARSRASEFFDRALMWKLLAQRYRAAQPDNASTLRPQRRSGSARAKARA